MDGLYLEKQRKPITFRSGCVVLDCTLGGGWATNRVINVVGDKSTGKTLLAIEAAANFVRSFDSSLVRYCDTEAAFDRRYAADIGFPLDSVQLPEDDDKDIATVEDFFEDVKDTIDKRKKKPCLYVLDSLDALSDRAEESREIDKGSYGAAKAKQMSQMFRRTVRRLRDSNVTLMVISQVRDKIGVSFGESNTRSGGRALDFYASQIVWLAHRKILKRTRNKVERPYGVWVQARCKKNKIGLPHRDCEFPILFEYGIDDAAAGASFLLSAGHAEDVFKTTSKAKTFIRDAPFLDQERYDKKAKRIRKAVKKLWRSIEEEHRPKRKKYT